jgi:hypothetical protein
MGNAQQAAFDNDLVFELRKGYSLQQALQHEVLQYGLSG